MKSLSAIMLALSTVLRPEDYALLSQPRHSVRSEPRHVGRHWRSFGKYSPHQGTRECLRRVGGEAWARFKENDRVRRGLPPQK